MDNTRHAAASREEDGGGGGARGESWRAGGGERLCRESTSGHGGVWPRTQGQAQQAAAVLGPTSPASRLLQKYDSYLERANEVRRMITDVGKASSGLQPVHALLIRRAFSLESFQIVAANCHFEFVLS